MFEEMGRTRNSVAARAPSQPNVRSRRFLQNAERIKQASEKWPEVVGVQLSLTIIGKHADRDDGDSLDGDGGRFDKETAESDVSAI